MQSHSIGISENKLPRQVRYLSRRIVASKEEGWVSWLFLVFSKFLSTLPEACGMDVFTSRIKRIRSVNVPAMLRAPAKNLSACGCYQVHNER
jgi:hypothetical protein